MGWVSRGPGVPPRAEFLHPVGVPERKEVANTPSQPSPQSAQVERQRWQPTETKTGEKKKEASSKDYIIK
jgi:hypothetical protein